MKTQKVIWSLPGTFTNLLFTKLIDNYDGFF
jgi:hypothetical protein